MGSSTVEITLNLLPQIGEVREHGPVHHADETSRFPDVMPDGLTDALPNVLKRNFGDRGVLADDKLAVLEFHRVRQRGAAYRQQAGAGGEFTKNFVRFRVA